MDGTFSEKALFEVMTAAEAAEKWGLNPRSIQQACTGYKGVGNLDFGQRGTEGWKNMARYKNRHGTTICNVSQLSIEFKRR